MPVVVEMSLSQLSLGANGDAGGTSAKKMGSAAPAAAKPQAGKEREGSLRRRIELVAGKAALPKAAEPTAKTSPAPVLPSSRPVQAAARPVPAEAHTAPALPRPDQSYPRPVPAVPVLQPPARQSGETKIPSGRQTTGSVTGPGSAAGEQGRGGRGLGATPAGGASAARGGGAASPGTGNSGDVAGPGNGSGSSPDLLRKKYISENFAYIQKIIRENIVYPKKALRQGLSGKAFVSFTVLEDGQVANIRILHSTEYEILDLNLIETIKRSAPFPKPPQKAVLQMPFTYSPVH